MEAMVIQEMRITRLQAPWVEPPQFSVSFSRPRDILIVEIETADGMVGMGYLLLLGPGIATIASFLHEVIGPAIIGRDASAVEAIWQDLWRGSYWVGRMGVSMMAQSAVDIALWDLIGKQANMPLHRLWGQACDRIPAYVSGCWRGLGGDGMIDKAKRYVDAGFTAIKMQCGLMHGDRADVANVAAMRKALGPDIRILIDINMGWTADQAIAVGRQLQDYDIYWLEEPVPVEDVDGYLRIAEALNIRVVGGENNFNRHDIRSLITAPSIPILQPDVMRGGLTELRKIAVLADAWSTRLAPHLFPELMVQLMASIPNGEMLEYVNWLDDAWVDPVLPEAGFYTPPERPGHGLVFDPGFIAKHQIASTS